VDKFDIRPGEVSVELVGGLGNQLFGYFAGWYLSETLGCQYQPFWLTSRVEAVQRELSVTQFELPHQPVSVGQIDFSFPLTLRFALQGIMLRLGLSNNFARKIFGVFTSKVVGEDQGLLGVKPGQVARGYFQSNTYFEGLAKLGKDVKLRLSNESDWFSRTRNQIIQESPIVIHVRRGDYLSPTNSKIGTLSKRYYLDALMKLESDGLRKKRLWIFSDDVPSVQEEFGEIEGYDTKWVQPPSESTSAESMILMGLGSGIIVSNSTFSWWAARLGSAKRVVAPDKWFLAMSDPVGLLPEDWLRVESSWRK
jgi:hypothetical protein